MSNVKTLIVIEDRLNELFKQLPDINGYKPHFGYGDSKELNAFLKHRERVKPYPLIWLLYPYDEVHNKRSVEVKKMTLILSVQTNSSMENPERIDLTFKKYLIPLLDNLVMLLNGSNIVSTSREYTITKFPNYSSTENGDEHAGTFIWDAIRLTFSITLTDDCLRKFNF